RARDARESALRAEAQAASRRARDDPSRRQSRARRARVVPRDRRDARLPSSAGIRALASRVAAPRGRAKMRGIVIARDHTMHTARIAHRFGLALLAATLVAAAAPGAAETSDSDRLIRASEVLVKFTAEEESSIPVSLLERAHGVAVIPSLVRGGFFIGG